MAKIRQKGALDLMSQEAVVKITDRLKKQEVDYRTKQELALHRVQTIRACAEPEWRRLRKWIEVFCDDANREMGSDMFTVRITPTTELLIDAKLPGSSRLLEISFDPPSGCINYDHHRSCFAPSVDAHEGFTFLDQGHPIAVADMGEKLMNVLTR